MGEQQQALGFLPTKGFWRSRPRSAYSFWAFFVAAVLAAVSMDLIRPALPASPLVRYALAGLLGVLFTYTALGIAERIVRSKSKPA